MEKQNVIAYLKYYYNEFTPSEQLIARHFIDKENTDNLKITEIAEELYMSTATVSRFVNKIGYQNYKQFIYEFQNSLNENSKLLNQNKLVSQSLWDIHKQFYMTIYENLGSIDLNFIANRIYQSKLVYLFGFGKADDVTDLFITRMETVKPDIKTTSHFEHMIYTIENVADYQNLIVIFYQHHYFKKDVELLIETAKEKFVPIIIISLSQDVDTLNYAQVYKLYPQIDETIPKFTTTMYTPYLIFIDALHQAIEKRVYESTNRAETYF